MIRDDITRTKTKYINKTRERNRGFDTANRYTAVASLELLSNNARPFKKLCRRDGGDIIENFSILNGNIDDINK
jgi:hypothetical protein